MASNARLVGKPPSQTDPGIIWVPCGRQLMHKINPHVHIYIEINMEEYEQNYLSWVPPADGTQEILIYFLLMS